MKKNILLIINPTAGSIDAEYVRSQSKLWARKLDCDLKLYTTTGEGDQERVEELIAEHDFERVVVAGGDGTIKLAAAVLVDSDLVLGILACGSANGLAMSLDMPKDLNEQLELALTQEATTIDTIMVNDHLCVHIADIGLNAELIYNYEKSQSSGKLGYAIQSIPTLFQSECPYEFSIALDERQVSGEGVLLAFANARKYGTGIVVNPDGQINDGQFEVIVFEELSLKEVFKTFINNFTIQKTNVKIYHTTSVTVQCKEEIPLQVDGEFIGAFTNFSARVKPKSLKIAMPK